MNRAAWVVGVAALLAGCASAPPAFTPNLAEARVRLAGTIGTVVASVDPAAQSGGAVRTTFGRDTIAPLWQRGVASAIDQSRLFDRSPRVLNVGVTIVRMQPPKHGGTIDTPAVARYRITDATTGAVVFETVVETVGHVGPAEDFLGAVRIHESIDRAVQSNIKMFVEQLTKVRALPQ